MIKFVTFMYISQICIKTQRQILLSVHFMFLSCCRQTNFPKINEVSIIVYTVTLCTVFCIKIRNWHILK